MALEGKKFNMNSAPTFIFPSSEHPVCCNKIPLYWWIYESVISNIEVLIKLTLILFLFHILSGYIQWT